MSGLASHRRAGPPPSPPSPEPLPIAVVDNHTHLDLSRDSDDAPDVQAVIDAATAVGVPRMVQIGCDLPSARFTVEIINRYAALLGGVALHPNEAPRLHDRSETDSARREIELLAADPRVRVIGETGLDYFRTGTEGVAAQQDSFRWHIDLAKRTGKALQVHDRDAHEDVLRILAEETAPPHTVLHCFSGDITMARECVERGYFLSFAGTVTFKNAKGLRNALAVTPLANLLVETDAPFLTPAPHRGAANAPYLVPLTVRAMATVLSTDVPSLCTALAANSEGLYGPW